MAARENVDTGGGPVARAARGTLQAVQRNTNRSYSRSQSRITKKSGSSRGTSSGGYSSRSRSSGSSGSGGGRGRSSSGSLMSGRSATNSGRGGGGGAPDIKSYLGTDSVYQQAVRGGKRSLTDFLSEIGRRRGEATTQFTQTKGSMERDRTRQLSDLQNEFASRGLIQSGLYGEEQGRFQQQFTDQFNALGQQQNSLLADLMSQSKNYSRENDLALEAAKQEALARRAARYKIGA